MKHRSNRSASLPVLGIVLVLLAGLVFAMQGNAGDRRAPAGQSAGQSWVRPQDGAAMVYVPRGSFLMGATESDVDSEMAVCNKYHAGCHICNPGRDICHRQWFDDQQPAHDVALDSFWLDQTEVTNRQYALCVQAGRCAPPYDTGLYTRAAYYSDPMYADYPVIYVNWAQASRYCRWIGGRLPTEAEWEYAARGPERRAFPWGAEFDGGTLNFCDKRCWVPGADSDSDDGYAETSPAGSYSTGASWVGALDLAGNVAEWVADWYGEDYYADSPGRNPQGPPTGERRVQRGGAWGMEPVYAQTYYRTSEEPSHFSVYAGFRCAMPAPSR